MEKVKRVKCEFCKKRYVPQQDWKTEEEKKHCFTCWSTINFIRVTESSINAILKSKGFNHTIRILIDDNDAKSRIKNINKLK